MTANEYVAQMVYTFVSPHNAGYYPPLMGTAEEQALGTKRFQKNQALFRRYTAVGVALKKQIIATVKLVSLSPRVDYFTGFVQVASATLPAKGTWVSTLLLGTDLLTLVLSGDFFSNPHQYYTRPREGKGRVFGSVNRAFFNIWA